MFLVLNGKHPVSLLNFFNFSKIPVFGCLVGNFMSKFGPKFQIFTKAEGIYVWYSLGRIWSFTQDHQEPFKTCAKNMTKIFGCILPSLGLFMLEKLPFYRIRALLINLRAQGGSYPLGPHFWILKILLSPKGFTLVGGIMELRLKKGSPVAFWVAY